MRRAARSGHPVRRLTWVPLDSIAPVAACAIVLAEDEDFFDKGTVSWRAQRVLAQRMLRGDFTRGGSGLSQQLARNLFLTADRTPRRKAREYLLAYQLSHALPKSRMLELYLNVVEFGEGTWGIEAASRRYFGVSASQLTASQGDRAGVVSPGARGASCATSWVGWRASDRMRSRANSGRRDCSAIATSPPRSTAARVALGGARGG